MFKLSIVVLFVIAGCVERSASASIPDADNSPVIVIDSNYDPVKDQPSYNLQDDVAVVKSSAEVIPGDNSTSHASEPVKGWFYRAVDFVENAFTGMLDKSTSFVKGFEEKNTDDDKSFWNRSSQVIEAFGQKFLKVRTVEKKVTNNSIAYVEKEVIKPLTAV